MALIRSIFQEELDAVSQTLVDLTKMVSDSINKATTSLIDANLSLAEEVITFDEKVDQIQHDLDARINPFASSLSNCFRNSSNSLTANR